MDFSPISRQLSLDNPQTRLAALAKLQEAADGIEIPPAVVAGLLLCLGDHTKAVQRGAAEQLIRFSHHQPAIIEALSDKLADADPRIRWTAAYALSALPLDEPLPLPVLIENIGHQESDLRWAAATALLRLAPHHPSVLAALLDLTKTGNPVQRRMALYCLRDANQTNAAAQQIYLASLTDQESGVRLAALSCIGKCQLPLAALESPLIQILETDPDSGVRRAAAVTLGQLRAPSPAIVTALTQAARGEDVSLGKAAAGALQKLQEHSAKLD